MQKKWTIGTKITAKVIKNQSTCNCKTYQDWGNTINLFVHATKYKVLCDKQHIEVCVNLREAGTSVEGALFDVLNTKIKDFWVVEYKTGWTVMAASKPVITNNAERPHSKPSITMSLPFTISISNLNRAHRSRQSVLVVQTPDGSFRLLRRSIFNKTTTCECIKCRLFSQLLFSVLWSTTSAIIIVSEQQAERR